MRALASRLVQSVVTLLLLSVALFRLLTLMPGNAVEMMVSANPSLRPEDVVRLTRLRGLDRPWHVQYARWAWGWHDAFNPPSWRGPSTSSARMGEPWSMDVGAMLDGAGPVTPRLVAGEASLEGGVLRATFAEPGVHPVIVEARDAHGLVEVVRVDVSVDGEGERMRVEPIATQWTANASVDLGARLHGAQGPVAWRVVEGPGRIVDGVYAHAFDGPGRTLVVVEAASGGGRGTGAFVVDHGPVEDPSTFHPGVLLGDLGFSSTYKRPVAELLDGRMSATLRLALPSLLLAVLLSVVLGAWAARRPGGPVDRVVSTLATVGVSVPVFWTGLLAIIVFAVTLRWLPPGGMETPGETDLVDALAHAVLPVGVLTLFYAGRFIRYVRAGMIDVMQQDFIRTARALGLPEWRVTSYALRNALVPLVTVLALSVPGLFSGAVLTETVFSWPGMGRLVYESVLNSDHAVAMIAFLVSAAAVMLANLAADALHAVLDPRIREPR